MKSYWIPLTLILSFAAAAAASQQRGRSLSYWWTPPDATQLRLAGLTDDGISGIQDLRTHQDPRMRIVTAQALAGLGSDKALATLIEMLGDGDDFVESAIIQGIKRFENRGVEELVRLSNGRLNSLQRTLARNALLHLALSTPSVYREVSDLIRPLRCSNEVCMDSFTPPSYPPLALQAGIEGTVYLALEIAADGSVQRASAKGSQLLLKSAEDAARSWSFEPLPEKHTAPYIQSTTIHFSIRGAVGDPGSWGYRYSLPQAVSMSLRPPLINQGRATVLEERRPVFE